VRKVANVNSVAQCLECPTRRLCLAAGLNGEAIESLSECVHPSSPMSKGDLLYRTGDAATDCFVVRSGAYKTFAIRASGEEYVTGFYFPGELMGISGQAVGEHRDTAMALETSTACRVQLDDVPSLWSIGSGRSLLRLMGRAEQMSVDDHVNLSQSAADARVAGFLVTLSRRMKHQGRDPLHLPTPMSRTDLANYLGMTLECLSRVVARLGKAGLVTATRAHITIESPDQLMALAGHIDQ
jgi:CRP/FNR family transcriptional regulator